MIYLVAAGLSDAHTYLCFVLVVFIESMLIMQIMITCIHISFLNKWYVL